MAAIDVTGLPEDKVKYLEQLVESWRPEEKTVPPVRPTQKRKVDPSEYIVKKSYVIGGKVTRTMAYKGE